MRLILKAAAALAAVLSLLIAGFIASSWAPDKPASELAARWAGPPSQFILLDGMHVHIRDEGRRDDTMPVVLIHGTSSNLHTWDGWTATLSKTRRVVRMDLPGFGLTGPNPDGDYTPGYYSHFIIALMDQLAIRRAVLAGNSLGGGIAWMTAVTAPDRVGKLILIDAAGYPAPPASMPIGFRLARMPLLRPVLAHILPRGVIESSLRNVYGDPGRVTPALVDQYFDMAVRAGNREALTQRIEKSRFDLFADRIHGIATPTLILWGALDRLIPPASAARFHADIAGSTLVMLPGLGHVPMEEDPAASLAAAQAFLAE